MLCLKGYAGFCLVVGTLLGSGCGFRPLYHQKDPNNSVTQLESIYIAPIKDRQGHYLRNQLMDTLTPRGTPLKPAYDLRVTLSEGEREAGFRRDATARRTILDLTATLVLVDKESGVILWTDKLESTSAYSTGSQSDTAAYPAIVASDAAMRRALDLLVGQIRQSLALYFDRAPELPNRIGKDRILNP